MSWSFEQARAFVPEFFSRLRLRRDARRIDSVEALARFVSSRAAFVAQKTLYGYVKTRMGTRYPRMFEDDVFIASIDIAKMHVFAACLSDLAVFAVSRGLEGVADDALHRAVAARCFDSGLADNAEQAERVAAFSAEAARAAFARRIAFVDWSAARPGPDYFAESPAALFRWAPIAPTLKRDDQEIVENSIRFAWRDVRAQFVKRLDRAALAAAARADRPA